MMKHENLFDWITCLIEQKECPAQEQNKTMTGTGIMDMQERIKEEAGHIQSGIMAFMISIKKADKQIAFINRQYQHAVYLLEKVWEIIEQKNLDKSLHHEVPEAIELTLRNSLHFMELKFSTCLTDSLDLHLLPDIKTKHAINELANAIQKNKAFDCIDTSLAEILRKHLLVKTNQYHGDQLSDKLYRILIYEKLMLVLQQAELADVTKEVEQVLFEFNFNHEAFIAYTIHNLEKMINDYPGHQEKIHWLLFYQKSLNQIVSGCFHYKKKAPSIRTALTNWVASELHFLERTASFATTSPSFVLPAAPQDNGQVKNGKIQCSLSVDQMGILLRAAKAVSLIVSPSLNSVFKTIVPHLSTASTISISSDSMRSKSYAAEKSDKDIVIALLQRIIQIIKDF